MWDSHAGESSRNLGPSLLSVPVVCQSSRTHYIASPNFRASYFHDFGDKCREIASKLAKFADYCPVASDNNEGSVDLVGRKLLFFQIFCWVELIFRISTSIIYLSIFP